VPAAACHHVESLLRVTGCELVDPALYAAGLDDAEVVSGLGDEPSWVDEAEARVDRD
jgi:hypothetical protein